MLSTTHYLVVKEVFKHLDEEALINCYNDSQDFRYFAKERLNRLNKIEWKKISKINNLSENFIKEYKDKVNCEYISQYQILSEKENFIKV